MGLIKRTGHHEVTPDADFASHQRYIDAALQLMQYTVAPVTDQNMPPCRLYNQNLNSDGYPRIRYAVRGTYRVWDDQVPMQWSYVRGGRNATRTKLADYRVYVHSYVYWRNHGEYRAFANRHNLEISHRCGNRNCGEVQHYLLENHTINLSRIGCPKGQRCNHWWAPCI